MPANQGWFLGLILQLALGSEPTPNLVDDVWESVQRENTHIGFVHTTVESLKGGKLLRGSAEMKLTFRRQGSTLSVRQEQGTEENADGMVVRVFSRQFQGSKVQVDLRGALEDGKMHVVIDNGAGRIDRRLRWSEDVLGFSRRLHWFEERKPRPGAQLAFQVYDPTYNTVVTNQAVVGAAETVPVSGKRQKLLRVDVKPDVIVTPGQNVQVPAHVIWLDDQFVPVRRQIELEGLGTLVLTRCSRAQAMPGGGAVPDINTLAMIPLNRPIPQPHGTRSIIYRVTVKGDQEPGQVLVQDGHQDIRKLKGNTFELHVHPVQPGPREKGNADPEYLASNSWITSDDERVANLAKLAVGMETDPWKKAQAIERWVKRRMRVDNVAPFVPARGGQEPGGGLPPLCTADGRAVPGRGSARADCNRHDLRSRSAHPETFAGFPHVDGGVDRRSLAGPGCDARAGSCRGRPHQGDRP